MFNREKPSLEELPSTAQLLRSTIFAALGAVAILVVVVLPAEYGVDPTGVGRLLGLTEMGDIKQELADEAEQDEALHGSIDPTSGLWHDVLDLFVATARAEEPWQDEVTFTLAPGESAEVKLAMAEDATAIYRMVVEGGRVNVDLHGHGSGESVTYDKTRGASGSEGELRAAFAGDHGWFWRNRDSQDITVTLQIRGDYQELKQDI